MHFYAFIMIIGELLSLNTQTKCMHNVQVFREPNSVQTDVMWIRERRESECVHRCANDIDIFFSASFNGFSWFINIEFHLKV